MTRPRPERLRLAAGIAAALLAVLSQGDLLVVAGLLAVLTLRPLPALAVLAAAVGCSWRWGSTSLEAIAGDQAVLGPAGLVGPWQAAAASWLAGLALLLAVRAPGPALGRVAAVGGGAAVAVVVAGPAADGALWVRAVATLLAVAVALWLAPLLARAATVTTLDAVALASGLGACALAATVAPPLSGAVDGAALRAGLVLAVAVFGLVVAGDLTITALRHRHA